MNDRKRYIRWKEDFAKDMCFNLQNGSVNRTTNKFLIKDIKVNTSFINCLDKLL